MKFLLEKFTVWNVFGVCHLDEYMNITVFLTRKLVVRERRRKNTNYFPNQLHFVASIFAVLKFFVLNITSCKRISFIRLVSKVKLVAVVKNFYWSLSLIVSINMHFIWIQATWFCKMFSFFHLKISVICTSSSRLSLHICNVKPNIIKRF